MTNEEFLKWIELAFLGGFVALIGWTGSRLHKRLDEVEATKASKKELEAAINAASEQRSEMLSAMAEHRKETRDSFGTISETLTQVLLRLPK